MPEKLVQGRGCSQWLCTGLCLRRPSVNPPRDGVPRVSAAPTDLGLLPSRGLAARLPASVLAASCAGAYGRNHRRQIEHGLFRPLAWRCFMVTMHRCVCGIQLKLPGSVLESTGGSILASAEEAYWSVPFSEPATYSDKFQKTTSTSPVSHPLSGTPTIAMSPSLDDLCRGAGGHGCYLRRISRIPQPKWANCLRQSPPMRILPDLHSGVLG